MEVLSPRNVYGAVTDRHGSWSRFQLRRTSPKLVPLRSGRIRCRNGGCRGVISSKLSKFPEFQGYARPSRLFPTTKIKVCTGLSEEEKSKLVDMGDSRSMYEIKIHTSRMYGSSLSDVNGGILLCLIDENGNSLLQRVPAIHSNASAELEEKLDGDIFHFQQASVDEFIFEGPKLGRLQALWISTESGRWRLGGATLSVVSPNHSSLEELSTEQMQYTGYRYEFEAEDILVGEGSDSSMVELKPCLATELSGEHPFTLLSNNMRELTSTSPQISKEESMREYADLKLSLLLYDAALISIGAGISSLSAGKDAALAFLTGGLVGFLYLLILQRSVDELPAPAAITRSAVDEAFRRLRGPIITLALVGAFAFTALKYNSGEVSTALTSEELIFGMIGFLACKLAVVLAAFKPVTISLK